MQRPVLEHSIFASVTETLALWLARGRAYVADDLLAWRTEHWRAAEWVAYWHGAIPLWVERLGEADLTGRQYPSALKEIAALSHARTQRMLDDVQELVLGLHARGVEVAPLKGARLAPFYYEPATLRALGDIDLLIHPQHLATAQAWMEAHDYVFHSRSEEDVVYLRGTRLSEVWHPDNVHPVELHFRLREEFGGAGLTWDLGDEAWQTATKQPYMQTETYLIASLTLLRHLCAHTSSDMFIRRAKLQQLEDIARVALTFSDNEWQQFVATLPRGRARFVYPALALTARYYLDVLPAGILRAFSAALTPQLRAWSDGATLAAVSESNLAARNGIGVSLARLLAESRGESARTLVRSLLPPRWNLSKRYPRLAASPFYPVCYILLNADRAIHVAQKLSSRERATLPGANHAHD